MHAMTCTRTVHLIFFCYATNITEKRTYSPNLYAWGWNLFSATYKHSGRYLRSCSDHCTKHEQPLTQVHFLIPLPSGRLACQQSPLPRDHPQVTPMGKGKVCTQTVPGPSHKQQTVLEWERRGGVEQSNQCRSSCYVCM